MAPLATIVIFAYLVQTASSLPTDASALESAISALESEIRALENSSAPWEHRVHWFTTLVAVGVLTELWVLGREHREHLKAWRRGTIRSPERPSTFDFVVSVLSVIAITAGIAGEIFVGIKINAINGVLRSKNAELRRDSDRLVGLLQAQIEQDKIKLQIQLAQLKRSEGQRYLSPDEQNQLVRELSKYNVKHIMIWCRKNDPEASRFGDDFEKVFGRLKWDPHRSYVTEESTVQIVQGKRMYELVTPGITIGVDDPAHPPKIARALQAALKNLDFPFESHFGGPWWGWGQAKPDPNFFTLAIGSR